MNTDALFVDIITLRAEVLPFKAQIRLDVQTRAFALKSQHIAVVRTSKFRDRNKEFNRLKAAKTGDFKEEEYDMI